MPVDRGWLVLGAETAGLATACAAVLGVPLAWLLENRQFAGKRTVSAIVTAAIALPAPLLCYMLMGHAWPLNWPGTVPVGVLSVLPFFTGRMRAAFAGIDRAFGKAARSLGVPEGLVLVRVELPLVRRALAESTAWALARLLLEFGAAVLFLRARV